LEEEEILFGMPFLINSLSLSSFRVVVGASVLHASVLHALVPPPPEEVVVVVVVDLLVVVVVEEERTLVL
jgi:hypothetical protein